MASYSSKLFDYSRDYSKINFREHPELYQVGKGEQGVLMVEPYKSEILPYWRFKNPEIAHKSAKAIYRLFLHYKRERDFVGMDMARKFLQMGFTRSRRYANHPTGKKYEIHHHPLNGQKAEMLGPRATLPQAHDWATNEKSQSAEVFYGWYLKAKDDAYYLQLKEQHQKLYG
ncbi:MAG: DUF4385 domain-containing protein [Patescibacteria group bacterium]